jgi:transcriptional regulator with XRE-family HTH domain
MNLGETLKHIRDQAGLTQKGLATAAGVSVPFLAQIEKGDRSPSLKTLIALCNALKLQESEKQDLIRLYEGEQRVRLQDKAKNRELALRNTVVLASGEMSEDKSGLDGEIAEANFTTVQASRDMERGGELYSTQPRGVTRQMSNHSKAGEQESRFPTTHYFICRDAAAVREDLIKLRQEISDGNRKEIGVEGGEEQLDSLPTVCLVGLGRCGTNIALKITMLAHQAKEDFLKAARAGKNVLDLQNDGATESDTVDRLDQPLSPSSRRAVAGKRERKGTKGENANAIERTWFRVRNFFQEGIQYDAAEPTFLVIPIVLVGDLDEDLKGRIAASEYAETLHAPYQKKVRMLELSEVHHGGAGHVPVIGQYLAKLILNRDPDSTKSDSSWKLYHSYLIDSPGLKENASRVFFYIFSAGGGTGSGTSGEFGLAQQYSYHGRIHDDFSQHRVNSNFADSDTDGPQAEQPTRAFEPIFSAGVAILPPFDPKPKGEDYSQAIHVNAGRLICKYLAEEWRFSTANLDAGRGTKVEDILRPWNALMLVSNNIMKYIEESDSRETDVTTMEGRTNKYVAQQILNVLTAQAQTIDYDESFIREAGLNIGDMLRVDANDLYMSLVGPVAIAYAESAVPTKDGNGLNIKDVFFRSIGLPCLNKQTGAVEGISILPQARETYSETLKRFNDNQNEIEKNYDAFKNVKCFSKCPATFTIISVPRGYKLDSKKLSELKLAQEKIFPYTKLKRYALIVAASPYLSLTTIIARSACLSDEVLGLLFAYVKRCFAKELYKYGTDNLGSDKYSFDVESEMTHFLIDRLPSDTNLRTILRDTEDPSEIMLANWKEVKSTYERKYRDLLQDPEKFVPIDQILLTVDDVIDALRYIGVTLRHKGVPLKAPDVTSWEVKA